MTRTSAVLRPWPMSLSCHAFLSEEAHDRGGTSEGRQHGLKLFLAARNGEGIVFSGIAGVMPSSALNTSSRLSFVVVG